MVSLANVPSGSIFMDEAAFHNTWQTIFSYVNNSFSSKKFITDVPHFNNKFYLKLYDLKGCILSCEQISN